MVKQSQLQVLSSVVIILLQVKAYLISHQEDFCSIRKLHINFFFCCCNTLPQCQHLKITLIYYLTVLQIRNPGRLQLTCSQQHAVSLVPGPGMAASATCVHQGGTQQPQVRKLILEASFRVEPAHLLPTHVPSNPNTFFKVQSLEPGFSGAQSYLFYICRNPSQQYLDYHFIG